MLEISIIGLTVIFVILAMAVQSVLRENEALSKRIRDIEYRLQQRAMDAARHKKNG